MNNDMYMITCPNCKHHEYINRLEYQDYETLTCPHCGNDFQNPIKYPPKNNSKRIGIIVLVVIAAYYFWYYAIRDDAYRVDEFNQSDRKEIYYYDENGNINKRQTIYNDGRRDEYKNY